MKKYQDLFGLNKEKRNVRSPETNSRADDSEETPAVAERAVTTNRRVSVSGKPGRKSPGEEPGRSPSPPADASAAKAEEPSSRPLRRPFHRPDLLALRPLDAALQIYYESYKSYYEAYTKRYPFAALPLQDGARSSTTLTGAETKRDAKTPSPKTRKKSQHPPERRKSS